MKYASLILLIGMLILTSCSAPSCKNTICIKDHHCFEIETAITKNEREQGLMQRESLPEGQGMLFIFEEQKKHSFWMKDTLIPLDIIWLDKNQKITNIETAKPCTESPCEVYTINEDSQYVLEINAGLAEKNNIQKGDQAKIMLCE